MLRETFHRLSEDRQREVLEACLSEFSEHGYEAASTNRIVKRLGIAKGTLFKYAASKEALYLHLFQEVLTELAGLRSDASIYESDDLFRRLEELLELQLSYAQREPELFRFYLMATMDSTASIYPKVEALRRSVASQSMGTILVGVDWSLYSLPRLELLELYGWLLSSAHHNAVQAMGERFAHDLFAAQVRRQIGLTRKLLRGGVYRG
jgi:TetR/AcrR family transcriptional regulator